MAFNGSGTFNRLYSWVTDAANGIFVRADRMDGEMDGMATGLSTCLTKDGQTTPTANIPMGGFKITSLATGTGNTDAAAVQNVNLRGMCEGRLSLTTALPVTTSDVTAATTLYFTPDKGSCIALYDGTNWVRRTFSEISITNATLSASKPYDVFVYDNAGTATLELLVWTNDTTRATALTTQDGVLVKTGALTRRYVGTIRTDAASKFNDSYALRHVWNHYNRVLRPMRVIEAADSWIYDAAAFHQANANTANQLDFVVGWSEDAVFAQVQGAAKCTSAPQNITVAIGLDSTTTAATGCLMYTGGTQVAGSFAGTSAQYTTIPAVGRHTLVWLELASAGTTTWVGDAGVPTTFQSGIHGWIRG